MDTDIHTRLETETILLIIVEDVTQVPIDRPMTQEAVTQKV